MHISVFFFFFSFLPGAAGSPRVNWTMIDYTMWKMKDRLTNCRYAGTSPSRNSESISDALRDWKRRGESSEQSRQAAKKLENNCSKRATDKNHEKFSSWSARSSIGACIRYNQVQINFNEPFWLFNVSTFDRLSVKRTWQLERAFLTTA